MFSCLVFGVVRRFRSLLDTVDIACPIVALFRGDAAASPVVLVILVNKILRDVKARVPAPLTITVLSE